jgi:hypothetical protein
MFPYQPNLTHSLHSLSVSSHDSDLPIRSSRTCFGFQLYRMHPSVARELGQSSSLGTIYVLTLEGFPWAGHQTLSCLPGIR